MTSIRGAVKDRAAALGRRARQLRPGRPEPTFRYVFVVTYGRSGSTLTQGLLNALPRTVVRGENNFYLLELFRAWERVRAFRRVHMKHNPQAGHSAFYGLHEIRPISLVRSARATVTGHLLGSEPASQVDVLGFKEVLWHQVEPEETEAFFDFLDKTFPGVKFVLNQREHENVVGSGFWQGHDEAEVMGAIRRVEEIQQFLRGSRPDRSLDVHYEQITSDDPEVSQRQLRALAEFVHGSCDAETMAAMRATLEQGHGPYPFGKSRGRAGRRGR